MTNKIPIVQFASQIMYTNEGNTAATKEIEVMRIGALGQTCVVSYDVLDEGKELEGRKFHKCSGTLEFGPNETTKSFTLRLIEEKLFDSVVELPFGLTAVENCEVGAYLHRTRVKIVDDDLFPSMKFEQDTIDDPTCDSWKKDNDWKMLIEFFQLCYSINRPGARSIIIGDQINNLIYISQLEIGKQLITALSDSEHAWATDQGVVFFAILLTVPYIYTHLFSYRKQFWKVGGMIRKEMMQDLMVRCLYYEEVTRDQVNLMEVKQIFANHAFQLVGDGYMKVFEICAATGRLIMLLLYFLFNATKKVVEEDEPGLFFFVLLFAVIPAVVYLYMQFRTPASNRIREKTEDAKVELLNYVDAATDNYRVVADCWARPLVISQVLQKVGKINKKLVEQGARQANDMAFFGWASELVEAFVIILGGILVLHGNIGLGAFTSTMAGLRGATGQYGRMYKAMLSMQSTFPSLWLLVQYMNLPMDLSQRLKCVEENRKAWPDQLKAAKMDERVARGEVNAEDAMPIVLRDVAFEYKVNLQQKLNEDKKSRFGKAEGTKLDVLRSASLEIQQGTLIGVTGPPGHGKGTLLRVLAEVLMPTSGSIFVPSHLRVLHVELQENLYEGSVAFNVYFALLASRGLESVDDLRPEDRDRGVRVCRALDMMPQVVEAVEKYSEKPGTHLKGLSLTTKIRIQLARAFIVNPEVLVLHMPMDSLREPQAEVVIKQLRLFVKDKGVELPEDDSGRRRPRTCVFTSNHRNFLEKADRVWSVVDGVMQEKVFLEGASPAVALSLKPSPRGCAPPTPPGPRRSSSEAPEAAVTPVVPPAEPVVLPGGLQS